MNNLITSKQVTYENIENELSESFRGDCSKEEGLYAVRFSHRILEEISADLEEGTLSWDVVDVGAREGLHRLDELKKICGRKPVVPSIVINERIAFDNILNMESLTEAVCRAMAI